MSGWLIGGDYDYWKTTEPEGRADRYDIECASEEAALAIAEAREDE